LMQCEGGHCRIRICEESGESSLEHLGKKSNPIPH
jgi:hypothetical protein